MTSIEGIIEERRAEADLRIEEEEGMIKIVKIENQRGDEGGNTQMRKKIENIKIKIEDQNLKVIQANNQLIKEKGKDLNHLLLNLLIHLSHLVYQSDKDETSMMSSF